MDEAEDVGMVSQGSTTAPANTIPPSNAGFTLLNNLVYQMKNGQNRCAYNSASVLATSATCSATDASQRFAIYAMPGGTYNLCLPGTGVVADNAWCETWVSGSYGPSCISWRQANTVNATCFQPTKWNNGKATDGRFQSLILAERPLGSTAAFTAWRGLITESGGTLMMASRYLTNNSTNVVVLGSYSGNPDQKWSIF